MSDLETIIVCNGESLLTEINTALELALENRSWRDYFELARLQSDVSSYDSFELIGEP